MSLRKIDFLFIFILLIAAFFRFYNFSQLQYFSGDEEILTAVERHMIWDRSPTLIVPNTHLGFGLGPFFHYILAPFYFLTNFNLITLQIIPSLLGVVTTYLVYLAGNIIGGKKMGLLAGFLYASSSLIALYDRRLWPLTLNSFMSVLTFVILSKILKGNLRLIPILAIPVGFSFHADASLTVLTVSIMVCLFLFKFPVRNRYFLYLLVTLGIFILPLIAADIRYKGTVHGPVIAFFTRPLRGEGITSHNFSYFKPLDTLSVFSKIIWMSPSDNIEKEFCYCSTPTPPLFLLTGFLVIIVSTISFSMLFRYNSHQRKQIIILWFLMAGFFLGIFVYNGIFKANFFQHYFTIILPIFILIFSLGLSGLYPKFKAVLFLFLGLYFLLNLYTLLNSSLKYPLYEKIELVKRSLMTIDDYKFSLYSSTDPYVQGGGWTELYTLQKHTPVKSYWYGYWDWIYQAYSLFPGPIQTKEPERIVLIQKEDEALPDSLPIISRSSYKDLNIIVFENSQN